MDIQLSILGEPLPNETVIAKPTVLKVETSAAKTAGKFVQKNPRLAKPKIHTVPKDENIFESYRQNIINGLSHFFQKQKFKKGVLGLSGGVDSSLTLKLAVDALGAENITVLLMPELGLTKQENMDHAKALAAYFNVNTFYQPINTFLMDYVMLPWKPNKLSMMNAKARVRMTLLYNYANSENALVLGTSNRSEILLGYGTKFGDMACDAEVIGDLYKTEVTMLADYLGLPPEIVHKTPTAELSEGQTDEDELGATYEEMDKVLMKLSLSLNGCIEHGLPAPLVHKVFKQVEMNKHKSEIPFVIRAR